MSILWTQSYVPWKASKQSTNYTFGSWQAVGSLALLTSSVLTLPRTWWWPSASKRSFTTKGFMRLPFSLSLPALALSQGEGNASCLAGLSVLWSSAAEQEKIVLQRRQKSPRRLVFLVQKLSLNFRKRGGLSQRASLQWSWRQKPIKTSSLSRLCNSLKGATWAVETLSTAVLQEEETDVWDAILPNSVIAEVLVLVIAKYRMLVLKNIMSLSWYNVFVLTLTETDRKCIHAVTLQKTSFSILADTFCCASN